MFGDRLKELRQEKDLTQKQLGDIVNVSERVIGHYESNRNFPDQDVLTRFADYFDVSLDYLLDKSDVRKRYTSVNTPAHIRDAENLYKIDPEMLIQMCRASYLPKEERQKIKEYSALLIEKHLREKAERNKPDNGNK